jgi:hypothetical protein
MKLDIEDMGLIALVLGLVAFTIGFGTLFGAAKMLCGLAFLFFLIGCFGIGLGLVKMGFEFYVLAKWGKGGKNAK